MQATYFDNEELGGQGYFLALTPGHLRMKIKTCFPKQLPGHFY